jgi:hypothetical protein
MPAAPTWQALELQTPGKDLLKQVRQVLETLVIFLDVLKAILNVVKTFLQAIGNPIRALVELLMALIMSLIESLRRTGFYAWFNFPNFAQDPSLKRHAGGFPAFVQRFKGSLMDGQDINRPRPVAGFNTGGFVLIVADVQGPAKLLRLIKILIKFFSSSMTSPQYAAPSNAKVMVIGSKGDSILQIAQFFKEDLKGLAVEWGLPTTTGTADPGFSGLVSNLGTEFAPPQWLVERTGIYPSDETTDFDTVGPLFVNREDPNIRNPRTGKPIMKKYRVVDEYGQPVILLENAYVVNRSTGLLGFLLGQYRWLDKDVTADKPYWYRIRAFSGTLDWDASKKKINFSPDNIKADPNRTGVYFMEWPSKDPADAVVMGQATALIAGRLPKIPAKFDVYENLRHIFLAAFSLNFQHSIPLIQQQVYDPKMKEMVSATDSAGYPIYTPVLDKEGNPLPEYANQVQIGYGSLTDQAGALSSYQSVPIDGILAAKTSAQLSSDTPWTQANVRLQAARLTSTYASLMLEAGGSFLEGFRALMQGPLPFGPPAASHLTSEGWSSIKEANTVEKLVFGLTGTKAQPTLPDVDLSTAIANEFTWEIQSEGQARTYNLAWSDNNVRKNILAAVKFIKTLGYQGQPPDWIRLSLLQDILPWSGQMIYEMLAKIQALIDAFTGLLDDIVKFIDMIIRKIDVLEKFIEFLIMILNFIEQLSAGFYLLFATGLNNGVADWFKAIDEAGGDKPKSTVDGGYTAGLCLAYLAPNVAPLEAALKLIF